MRIENIRKEARGDRSRISARIIWENAGLPARELFFETSVLFADDLTPDPNAFLLAAILPAAANGENRILVEGRLCPELKQNLAVATGWLRKWYGPPRRPIRIQATQGINARPAPIPSRAASFMSGGIDSLATLRTNRLNYAPDHPRTIKDCLILHGFDIGLHAGSGEERNVFERTLTTLDDIARDARVRLIPVYTNARQLDNHSLRFNREYHGAVLAAAAHVFSKRLTSAVISSSHSHHNYFPWGSHPLLDPNYSSTGLQILHADFQYTRLEKVRIVAQWPAGLAGIRVCVRNPADRINCGECSKCIRTMLELYAIGKLGEAVTFPGDHLTVAQVAKLRPGIFRYQGYFLLELLPRLRRMGRHDLVRMILKRRRQYLLFFAWAERSGLAGLARDWDKRHFKSGIAAMLGRLL